MERLKMLLLIVFGLCLCSGNIYAAGGNDEYTVLLLHFNGQDGSTNIVDSSYKNYSVTAYDNAQIDTAEKKFGTGACLFDGAGDYLSIPDSPDWDFFGSNSDDKTIDFWVKFNNSDWAYCFVTQYENIHNFWLWEYDGRDTMDRFSLQLMSEGTFKILSYYDYVFDAGWHHIAVCKMADEYRIYVDGNLLGYVQSSATDTFESPLYIGQEQGVHFLDGRLDEFRISNGIARWTSDFTPPAYEYGIGSIEPPIADAGPDIEAYGGEEVTLDGSYSYDPDGQIISWVWRCLSDPNKAIIGEGEIVSVNAHGYVEEIIELTVTDDSGTTAKDTMKITNPGAQGPPGIPPEEIAVMESQITQLQQQNIQQQQRIENNRYLIEQLPQLKKKIEELETQVQ